MKLGNFKNKLCSLLLSAGLVAVPSMASADATNIYISEKSNQKKNIMIMFDNSKESNAQYAVPAAYDHKTTYASKGFLSDKIYWGIQPGEPTSPWIQYFDANKNHCKSSEKQLLENGRWSGKMRRHRKDVTVLDGITLFRGRWRLYLSLADADSQWTKQMDCAEDHTLENPQDFSNYYESNTRKVINDSSSYTAVDKLYMANDQWEDIAKIKQFENGYSNDADNKINPVFTRYIYTGNYLNWYWSNNDIGKIIVGDTENIDKNTAAEVYVDAIGKMIDKYPDYNYGLFTYNHNGSHSGSIDRRPGGNLCDSGSHFFIQGGCRLGNGPDGLFFFRDYRDDVHKVFDEGAGINHGGRLISEMKSRDKNQLIQDVFNPLDNLLRPKVEGVPRTFKPGRGTYTAAGAAPGETMYEIAKYITGGKMGPYANGLLMQTVYAGAWWYDVYLEYLGGPSWSKHQWGTTVLINNTYHSYKLFDPVPKFPEINNYVTTNAKGVSFKDAMSLQRFHGTNGTIPWYAKNISTPIRNGAGVVTANRNLYQYIWPGNTYNNAIDGKLSPLGSYKYKGGKNDKANLPIGQCTDNYLFAFGSGDTFQFPSYRDSRYHNGRGGAFLNNNTILGDLIPKLLREALPWNTTGSNITAHYADPSASDELAKWFYTQDISPHPGFQNMKTYTIGVHSPTRDAQWVKTAEAGGGEYLLVRDVDRFLDQLKFLEKDEYIESYQLSGSVRALVAKSNANHTGNVLVGMAHISDTNTWNSNLSLIDQPSYENVLSKFSSSAEQPKQHYFSNGASLFLTQQMLDLSEDNGWKKRRILTEPGAPGTLVAMTKQNLLSGSYYSEYIAATPNTDDILKYLGLGLKPAKGADQREGRLESLINWQSGQQQEKSVGLYFESLVTKCEQKIGYRRDVNNPFKALDAITGKARRFMECVDAGGDGHLTQGEIDDLEKDQMQTGNRWYLGDFIGHNPAQINYGNRTVAFVATSEALLHAIDLSKITSSNIEEKELWAYKPFDFLPQMLSLKENISGAKSHGLDAAVVSYAKDLDGDGKITANSTSDIAMLFFGTGRGEAMQGGYYAVDVKDAENPKLLWKRKFSAIQQSWSEPTVAYIPGYYKPNSGTPAPVLIFGGGYDAGKDESWGGDSFGKSIFIVDAATGKMVWGFGPDFPVDSDDSSLTSIGQNVADMSHSIPGGVTVMDSNGDGIIDRIYAVNTGAQVWRFDMPGNSFANWTANKIGDFSTAGATDRRSFMFGLDVASVAADDGSYEAIVIGSGNPERSKEYFAANGSIPSNADRKTKDRLYMIKDRAIGIAQVDPDWPITDQKISSSITKQYGWYLDLNDRPVGLALTNPGGERSTGKPLIVNGSVVLNTFVPPAMTQSNGCISTSASTVGFANSYLVDLLGGGTSALVVNNTSLQAKYSEDSTNATNVRTGSTGINAMLGSPIALVGANAISLLGGVSTVPGLALPPPTTASFWQQLIGKELSDAYQDWKDYLN